MRIYTRKGDFGRTSTIANKDISKDSLELTCIGTLDELNAAIGVTRSHLSGIAKNRLVDSILNSAQISLFKISSTLAGYNSTIDQSAIYDIEQIIDHYQSSLPKLKQFILPGGSVAAAHCHYARTVCRRAERLLVTLDRQQDIDKNILKFINRLSDLLFVLARTINLNDKREDITVPKLISDA